MYKLIFLYFILFCLTPISTFAASVCREVHRVNFGSSVAGEIKPGFLIQDNCAENQFSPKISHQLTIRAGEVKRNLPLAVPSESVSPRHWEVLFDLDRADLDADDLTVLDRIPPGTNVRVDGYTCQLGSEDYNRKLSIHRAAAVTKILKKHGVKVITQAGLGECCPISETNLSLNRRVIILEEK